MRILVPLLLLNFVSGSNGNGLRHEIQHILQDDNDDCDGATSVTPGVPTQGSTALATFDNVGLCGYANNTAAGVWFSVIGTGGELLASTCSNDTEYDTMISVFAGSCDELICVDGNDDADFCNQWLASEVVWDSVAGEVYSILVHGYDEETGDFELTVSESPEVSPAKTKLTRGNGLLKHKIQHVIQDITTDECQTIFHKLDVNNDAILTRSDLETILLGRGITKDEKNDFLLGVDNDATVTISELLVAERKRKHFLEGRKRCGKKRKPR